MTDASAQGSRGLALLLVFAAVFGSAACYRLTATKISSIAEKAGEYEGKTVTVYGTVTERIDLPRLKCYVLDDGSGTIAVSTTGTLPRVGEKMHARGRVKQAFAIGSRRIVGIIEPSMPTPTPMPEPPRGALRPS